LELKKALEILILLKNKCELSIVTLTKALPWMKKISLNTLENLSNFMRNVARKTNKSLLMKMKMMSCFPELAKRKQIREIK
jgi:hypothetical protein